MRFVSAISGNKDLKAAWVEVADRISPTLDPQDVDLLVVFLSGHAAEPARVLAADLAASFPNARIIGCTAEGTIGDGTELERVPSLSMLAGALPNVRIDSFHAEESVPERRGGWMRGLSLQPSDAPVFLVVGDPFSLDAHQFLDAVNGAFPGAPVLGGMASQARRPGENLLILDGLVHTEGLVGVALAGDITVDTVVSQGCRPIGQPFVVTRGERNIVRQLRNLTAMDALREVASSLPPEDLELVQQGLFLGRAIDEYKSTFQRGDFLIQNVVGGDPESGAIAIAGEVKVGTTVQFHVRDAASADEDLRNLLEQGGHPRGDDPYRAALLFSCNGRGTRMWEDPGHDVGVVRELHRGLPVAGFFAAGEIGPVGGRNFIHGFTASIALFRPKSV